MPSAAEATGKPQRPYTPMWRVTSSLSASAAIARARAGKNNSDRDLEYGGRREKKVARRRKQLHEAQTRPAQAPLDNNPWPLTRVGVCTRSVHAGLRRGASAHTNCSAHATATQRTHATCRVTHTCDEQSSRLHVQGEAAAPRALAWSVAAWPTAGRAAPCDKCAPLDVRRCNYSIAQTLEEDVWCTGKRVRVQISSCVVCVCVCTCVRVHLGTSIFFLTHHRTAWHAFARLAEGSAHGGDVRKRTRPTWQRLQSAAHKARHHSITQNDSH